MSFRSADSLDPSHIGRRVTVRRRLPTGEVSDVIGTLERCDTVLVVRDRHGASIEIERADVVAARLISTQSFPRQD